MAHVVLTFLGAASRYNLTSYDFGDGRPPPTSTVFGIALLAELKARHAAGEGPAVDQLVVLGTRQSGWDVLLVEATKRDREDSEVKKLASAGAAPLPDGVDEAMLETARQLIEPALGVPVRLVVIPYGRDFDEQTEILRAIVGAVGPGDEVTLDLTHGFRHLPALGLAAALFVEAGLGARVREICYGAYEIKAKSSNAATVVRLDGLLRTADWLRALHSFEKDADYGGFAELLEADGVPEQATRALHVAALLERLTQMPQAREHLRTFVRRAGAGWSGLSGLFESTLQRRLSEASEGSIYRRQRRIALRNVDHGDMFRAAVIGFEAFITRLVIWAGEDPHTTSFHLRDEIKSRYERAVEQARRTGRMTPPVSATWDRYDDLRGLRNTVAHTVGSETPLVALARANPMELPAALGKTLDRLLPERPDDRTGLPLP